MAVVSSNLHISISSVGTLQKTEMAICEMFCFFNFYFICTADKISFLQLSLLQQQQNLIFLTLIFLDLEEFWKKILDKSDWFWQDKLKENSKPILI